RFDLDADDMPRLAAWLAGAGVRWGLDQAQRDELGLGASGEQNTWLFGLRRMLLGYASGAEFQGIEPYDEVGGLDAALAGSLAAVVEALAEWRTVASEPATPEQWAARVRALVDAFVDATDERERMTVAALQEALRGWLDACARAGLAVPVPLAVLREAVL